MVALDAFAAAGLQSLREQTSEQLEAGTPVVEVLPKVPAVLLVGAPSAATIDDLLARAWMLAVGTGAPCLIIDCGGLADPGEQATSSAATAASCSRPRAARSRSCCRAHAGRCSELAARLDRQKRGLSFQHFDRFDSAVAHCARARGPLT